MEILEKSEKELKNREDFFEMFNKVSENRFTDHFKSLKSKADEFKKVLDKYVNDAKVSNN